MRRGDEYGLTSALTGLVAHTTDGATRDVLRRARDAVEALRHHDMIHGLEVVFGGLPPADASPTSPAVLGVLLLGLLRESLAESSGPRLALVDEARAALEALHGHLYRGEGPPSGDPPSGGWPRDLEVKCDHPTNARLGARSWPDGDVTFTLTDRQGNTRAVVAPLEVLPELASWLGAHLRGRS